MLALIVSVLSWELIVWLLCCKYEYNLNEFAKFECEGTEKKEVIILMFFCKWLCENKVTRSYKSAEYADTRVRVMA